MRWPKPRTNYDDMAIWEAISSDNRAGVGIFRVGVKEKNDVPFTDEYSHSGYVF